MNDEQKQIEEMALSLQDLEYTLPDDEDTRYRYFTRLDKQSAKEIAKALIAAGYRKQSEVIDEFVERLKEENEISLRRYGKGIRMTAIFKIADEMKFELFKQQEDKNER